MRWLVAVGVHIFSADDLQLSHRKLQNSTIILPKLRQWFIYCMLRVLAGLGLINSARGLYVATRQIPPSPHAPANSIYDDNFLNLRLNRIYDLPEVVVDHSRPATLNVLVPAFEFKSISAGFFGVFQVARFLRTTGYNIRLVLFDNFYYNQVEFKEKLKDYPGMERLFDELEVEYIGERKAPLRVSPFDNSVATVWYSAYFARKINSALGDRPFLYLIQDYESNFYPGGSHFSQADRSYEMNYAALFSSESLMRHFIKQDIGGIATRRLPYSYFDNACASHLPMYGDFIQSKVTERRKRLVFYSRPVVDRNMFELTALTLVEAYKRGIFDAEQWECLGMGLGDGVVQLLPDLFSTSLPRMTLKDYTEVMPTFDICLTLMASPHPSMIPMDLALSGALVVTNTFYTKTDAYLSGLSKNIIAAPPDLEGLLAGLRSAVSRVNDLDARYKAAAKSSFPRDWDQSLRPQHRSFVIDSLGLNLSHGNER